MRLFTLSELSRYSCATLRSLESRMVMAIAALPLEAVERAYAVENLHNIRRVLAIRRAPSPG